MSMISLLEDNLIDYHLSQIKKEHVKGPDLTSVYFLLFLQNFWEFAIKWLVILFYIGQAIFIIPIIENNCTTTINHTTTIKEIRI